MAQGHNSMVVGNSVLNTSGAPSLKMGLGTSAPTTTFHIDCRQDTKYTSGTKFPAGKSAIRFDSLQRGVGHILVIDDEGYVYRTAIQTAKMATLPNQQVDSLLQRIETIEQKLALLERDMDKCCMKVGTNGSTQRVPDENIKLYQNVPNPFTEGTEIGFYLPETVQRASIILYDLQGKEIRKIEIYVRGESSIRINAHELAAGMYIYALVADNREIDSKRMILTSH